MTVTRTGRGKAQRLAAQVDGLDGLEGKVGWLESARYPDGTPVAYVATIHEFGSGAIPARPFMRPTVDAHSQEWMDLLAQGARASLQEGGPTPQQVLELVTMRAAGDVSKAIAAVTSPPLKPMTIKRKGNDKPLVDTGQMIQSVTGSVEKIGVFKRIFRWFTGS